MIDTILIVNHLFFQKQVLDYLLPEKGHMVTNYTF